MKLLLVGDMHAKKDNIDESVRLRDWVIDLCLKHGATPVFMGDQYDTMAIKRVEVEEFWYETYKMIQLKIGASVSLTGNHDLNSDGTASAMTVHKDQTRVVGVATILGNDLGALPYIRDNEEFIKDAWMLYERGCKTILCHAEFNGAEYENGFFAPHGIDLAKCPPALFISGHIHKMQKFEHQNGAKVFYLGTPRHLTRSDAGQVKGVWLYDGSLVASNFFPTPEYIATPFTTLTITENGEWPVIPAENNGRVYVDIKGSKDFVDGVLKRLPEGAKVRTFVESQAIQSDIKESEGVEVAFKKYLEKYVVTANINPDQKQTIFEELLGGIK